MKSYVVVLILAFALSACGPFIAGSDDPDPERYREVLDRAEEDGLRPYWLGPQFDAAGLVWDQIDPSDGRTEDDTVVSVELHYFDADQTGAIDIVTMSEESFNESADAWRRPNQVTAEMRELTVEGDPIEFYTFCLEFRCPNGYQAIIIRDGLAVVASTSSYLAEDGSEANPLMDESVFLGVLAQLRPYPD
jgi:hypothetical protein